MHKVIARVDELRTTEGQGPCPLFKLHEEFDLSIPEDRSRICKWALNSMFPAEIALEFDGEIPFGEHRDRIRIACPDPDRIVVFELRRESKSPDTSTQS